MGIAYGLGLLIVGLIVSAGVFWLISIAEQQDTVTKRESALEEFHDRQNR